MLVDIPVLYGVSEENITGYVTVDESNVGAVSGEALRVSCVPMMRHFWSL